MINTNAPLPLSFSLYHPLYFSSTQHVIPPRPRGSHRPIWQIRLNDLYPCSAAMRAMASVTKLLVCTGSILGCSYITFAELVRKYSNLRVYEQAGFQRNAKRFACVACVASGWKPALMKRHVFSQRSHVVPGNALRRRSNVFLSDRWMNDEWKQQVNNNLLPTSCPVLNLFICRETVTKIFQSFGDILFVRSCHRSTANCRAFH